MQLQSHNLTDYLQCTAVIDWQTPAVIEQTQAVTASLTQDIAKAKALFEWVRDTIPHSSDIGADVVTCTASEVLTHRTGLCYAKSHLLAAMLRCAGIPAGFCYQGLALHGLNGLYIASLARWIRVDARGNTGAIDAQFSLTTEQLAFPVDPQQGEWLYETIYTAPVPAVINVLQGFTSLRALWPYLPEPFAEGAVCRTAEAFSNA
jgi:transglutaminase-like putative cysteine protease